VPTLLALAGQGHDIAAAYTRAAKPGGRRGLELMPSPVEREAKRLGLAVHTPASLKGAEAQAAFAAHQADAAIVVAYGLILPKPILDTPRLGCFNLHASLLPRWRGAAPINRAVMAGDNESGVTVMKMDEGLDTGDMAMTERIRIDADMTAGELHDAGAARRRSDGARVGRVGARHLAAHASARGRRYLRGKDRQGGDADRLDEVVEGRARPHPRAVAVSRRMV
jgi:methionyl-tRNA formyltransferase